MSVEENDREREKSCRCPCRNREETQSLLPCLIVEESNCDRTGTAGLLHEHNPRTVVIPGGRP